VLLVAEILSAFEERPARFSKDRSAPFALYAAGFLGTDLVEGLVRFGNDMEPVEDMQGLGALLADDLEIGSKGPRLRAILCRG
jgi:hypothetical protein